MSAEEEFKVFYAWQDDLPNKTNRSFIEKAAQDAIKRIAKKAELEKSKRPTFDKDTKGTKGAADIVATILSKIEACDLFIADVTSVCRYYTKGKEKNRRKESSNPNVLFELGYAFGTVGWEKTCLVLNTHYAKAETLPFDLRGRTLCTYDADPNNTSELARIGDSSARNWRKSSSVRWRVEGWVIRRLNRTGNGLGMSLMRSLTI